MTVEPTRARPVLADPVLADLDAEYKILGELGRGGTSVVYLARDREIGRGVVVKVIRAPFAKNEEALARFAREARTAAHLQHPNIVSVHAIRRLRDGSFALVMEYVPGSTLKQIIRGEGSLSAARAEAVLRQIAEALAFAHNRGVVHRDVRPENIFLDAETGRALLSDFGVAEQVGGIPVDGRSDVYGLGRVGWEMLTGSAPPEGDERRNEPLPSIRKLRPDTPRGLALAIDGALRMDPNTRWAGVSDFLAQLTDRSPTIGARRRVAMVALLLLGGSAAVASALAVRDPAPPRAYRAAPAERVGSMIVMDGTDADFPLETASTVVGVDLPDAASSPPAEAPRPAAEAPPSAGSSGFAVFAGGMHSCAIAAGGTSFCWGGNDRGQLGNSGTSGRASPGEISGDLRFRTISGGVTHSCGLTRGGDAFCWGANTAGQLGDGSTGARTAPTRVVDAPKFRDLGAGMSHTCALTREGDAFCWGANGYGQLGTDEVIASLVLNPVENGVRFGSLAVGWNHACGLTERGLARCWGQNTFGQLGDRSRTDRNAPVPVEGDRRFRTIAAGSAHTCALTESGAALCWGRNQFGQLGDGSTTDRTRPTPVRSGGTFASIATGSAHSCALTEEGAAFCWGRNQFGQLGDGSTTDRADPTPVRGGHIFAALHASGAAHTCGTTTSGEIFCWGYNAEGQLGDGTRNDRTTPVRIPNPGTRT